MENVENKGEGEARNGILGEESVERERERGENKKRVREGWEERGMQ